MEANQQAPGEEERDLGARLATIAHGSSAGSCKAKRALSSPPRRSIAGASLGKASEAISTQILARSSALVIAVEGQAPGAVGS